MDSLKTTIIKQSVKHLNDDEKLSVIKELYSEMPAITKAHFIQWKNTNNADIIIKILENNKTHTCRCRKCNQRTSQGTFECEVYDEFDYRYYCLQCLNEIIECNKC